MDQQQMLNECLRGKKEAQFKLYQKYAALMLGVCFRYTKSLEDAEDVLQEGFIKVFTHLHQFKHEGDLGAWIRRIMVNSAITYLNKHKRYRNEMELKDLPLHPVTNEDLEIKLETKALVDLIRQLPAGYQAVFNLVAIEGYEYAEVSQLLKVNINTLRSQYSRARFMLMQYLQKNKTSEITNYAGKI